jgi:hypothetical protein
MLGWVRAGLAVSRAGAAATTIRSVTTRFVAEAGRDGKVIDPPSADRAGMAALVLSMASDPGGSTEDLGASRRGASGEAGAMEMDLP